MANPTRLFEKPPTQFLLFIEMILSRKNCWRHYDQEDQDDPNATLHFATPQVKGFQTSAWFYCELVFKQVHRVRRGFIHDDISADLRRALSASLENRG
jgi:hypothetical protein